MSSQSVKWGESAGWSETILAQGLGISYHDGSQLFSLVDGGF